MPDLRTELKQGSAYRELFGIISRATKVHRQREKCTFKLTDEEITDNVFEFLVTKVENAEDNCPLHQKGGLTVGFTDCPNSAAAGFSAIGFK